MRLRGFGSRGSRSGRGPWQYRRSQGKNRLLVDLSARLAEDGLFGLHDREVVRTAFLLKVPCGVVLRVERLAGDAHADQRHVVQERGEPRNLVGFRGSLLARGRCGCPTPKKGAQQLPVARRRSGASAKSSIRPASAGIVRRLRGGGVRSCPARSAGSVVAASPVRAAEASARPHSSFGRSCFF